MSKSEKEKFIEFCGVLGFKVNDTQMKVFELYNQAKQENKEMFINLGRQQGRQYLNTILINFELWEKDQRIAELEKEKQTSVKEFADELYKGLNDLTKHGYTDDQWENICISKYDVEDKIIQLLKERGIE